jgi:transcriptional regulator with XRE-family HTH domain
MTTIQSISAARKVRSNEAAQKTNSVKHEVAEEGEYPEARVSRLYRTDGGPLVGWLFDEARRRRHDYKKMARAIGVTFGYIRQLQTGARSVSQISQDFAEGCASYLGVPTVVVKIVSGSLSIRDFASKGTNEREVIERAVRQMQDDVHVRQAIPVNLSELSLEAKKAVALLYAEISGTDVFGLSKIPEMVRWLQRAATLHNESEFAGLLGHRDTSQ